MKNWGTNRPTIKLTIKIFNNTHDISRTLTVTDNILLKFDTELTSNNSFLDISGVIKLDNITQQYIIKQSNPDFSDRDNLSSLFNSETLINVFYGSHPTTLLTNDCSINYKEFNNISNWNSNKFSDTETTANIIKSIGNTHHFNFSYEKDKSTILSLSFEEILKTNGGNQFRNKDKVRIKNIKYQYKLLNEIHDISYSFYSDTYDKDNISKATLDMCNIVIEERFKPFARLMVTYYIYEFNADMTKIERLYDYNLEKFQNDSTTLDSLYVIDNDFEKPYGNLGFGGVHTINNAVLWPTNIIYPDITNIKTIAFNDHLYFDNVKFTLFKDTVEINNLNLRDNIYTKDNIKLALFELSEVEINNVNSSYTLSIELVAYDLAGKSLGYNPDYFVSVTRGDHQETSKFEKTDFSYSQDFSGIIPFGGRVKVNNPSKYEVKPNDNIYPYVNDLYFGRYRGDNIRITYDNVKWEFLYDNASQKYTDTWWGNGTENADGKTNIDSGEYDLSKTELWNLKHKDLSYGNWGYWMNYYDNIYDHESIKNAYFKVPIDSVGKLQLSMRLRYNRNDVDDDNVDLIYDCPSGNTFSTFVINSMSAGGDPMIMTINGDMYKMSNFNGFSRMLQGMIHNKPIFINVETTESTKEECLEAAAWVKNELKNDVEFNNISEETYLDYDEAFMRKLWLSYNGQELLIDMDKQRILNNTFDGIKFYANDEKHIFPFYKNQEMPETVEIHLPNLGKLFVGYYDNPQIRTCFHFESETDIINAGGAIVHCLNAESIQIPSLTSTEFIHAHRNDECKYVIQYAVVTTNGENENENENESKKEITNINCY